MAELDQVYKIMYWLCFFILFLHTYFMIYFTESKIRLSSKFHSKKWKQQTSGAIFDSILYIEEVSPTSKCPFNYNEYPIYEWPGTSRGIYLNNVTYDHQCQMTIINNNKNFNNYKLNAIYSTGIGNRDIYTEYIIDTPYNELCINTEDNKCTCQELVVSFNKYNALLKRKNFTDKDRILNEITEIKPVGFGLANGNKLCMKKALNFSITNNIQGCLENKGVFCFEYICIFNETKCPDYKLIEDMLHNKNIVLSELNYNYNEIECSMLNNQTSNLYNTKINEEKHLLSNFANFNYLPTSSPSYCIVPKDQESNKEIKYEDLIVLNSYRPKQIYSSVGIMDKIKANIDDKILTDKNHTYLYSPYIDSSNDTIYLTGISHFAINKENISNCSEKLLQEVKFSIGTARKISLVKVGNVFLLEFGFIMFFCYILYNHFVLLSKKTQPQNKLYYVKHLIGVTSCFFIINFFIYYSNINLKNDIAISMIYLKKIVENNCFVNQQYMVNLKKINKRLEEFSLLSYQIYENLLIENISVILFSVCIIKSKMTFKQFMRLEKQF